MRGQATAAEMLRPSGSFGRSSGMLAQEALDRCAFPPSALPVNNLVPTGCRRHAGMLD